MPLANPDIIQVTINSQALGQEIEFVTHLRVESNADMADNLTELGVLATALAGDTADLYPFLTDYLACVPTGCKAYKLSCQLIRPRPRATPRVDYIFAGARSGTGGAGPSAPNIAASMPITANGVGRKYLAKYHIGPLPDSKYSDGKITDPMAAALKELQRLMTTNPFTLAIGGGGELATFSWVVFHRNVPDGQIQGHVLVLPRANPYVRVQRRRTIGVGK